MINMMNIIILITVCDAHNKLNPRSHNTIKQINNLYSRLNTESDVINKHVLEILIKNLGTLDQEIPF